MFSRIATYTRNKDHERIRELSVNTGGEPGWTRTEAEGSRLDAEPKPSKSTWMGFKAVKQMLPKKPPLSADERAKGWPGPAASGVTYTGAAHGSPPPLPIMVNPRSHSPARSETDMLATMSSASRR